MPSSTASLTDFALCFETPLPSSSPGSNRGRTSMSILSGGSQESLPMLSPGDTTSRNASFQTPVFQTPPNSGPPPPYIQPKPRIWSTISTPPNSSPPPPYVQPRSQIHSTTSTPPSNDPAPPHTQPKLGGSLKILPGPRTPANQGLPPHSSGNSEQSTGSASSSGSSFLTPGTLIHISLAHNRFKHSVHMV